MSSLRHIEDVRDTNTRLLDAAREAILSVGWRRTTLTDIARRAGVSRMTVYRAHPDITALFGDLMTREWAGIAAAVATEDVGSPEALADLVVDTVRALRTDEMFRRILDVDPDLLLPYLLDRRGRTQDAFIELLESRIAQGQRLGVLRLGAAHVMARSLLLAAHGHLLSARTMVDDTVELDRLDHEFAHMIGGYLAP